MRRVLKAGISIGPFRLGPSGLLALALIGLAVIVRISLLALGWPALDSDEGTMGLMGMHIAYRGELPIFLYGQGYMGVAEAYLAAVLFQLFGVSAFVLRLGLVLMYVVFLLGMYLLSSLLYSKRLALFTLFLLALGSNQLLTRQLVAVGGVLEVLLCAPFLLLIPCWLARSAEQKKVQCGRRLPLYFVWGLLAGFGLWSHLLVAPFLLCGGLLLLGFCWRDIRSWAPLVLLLGLLLGSAPLVSYNLSAPPGRDTLSIILGVHSAAGLALPPKDVMFPLQVRGALLIALPLATGATPLCAPSQVKGIDLSSRMGLQCTLMHTGWSAGLILLWIAAFLFAFIGIWAVWRARSAEEGVARLELVRESGRLALLLTALLTLWLYIISPDSALFSIPTARYLSGLLVATPAILWPLWNLASLGKPFLQRSLQPDSHNRKLVQRSSTVFGRSVIVAIALILLLGTFAVFTGIPAAPPVEQGTGLYTIQVQDQHLSVRQTRVLNRRTYALINYLLQAHITHIYSDYWTCNRLIFQSRERIICSVLKDNLRTGQNRYPPYHAIVAADQHATFIFQTHSFSANLFAQRVQKIPGYRHFGHVTLEGYEIFQPR